MLIKKGGISREIDEKRLEAYKEKGYEVVPAAGPYDGMKKADLEALATERGIDLSGCKTNAERIAALEAAEG